MKIRDAILKKQSEERTNISRGFELEKAKAVPIGTVNKYGEVKTAQGWVYQKKGTQKAELGKEVEKKDNKYQPHEIGEDKNDNRFTETPYDEIVQHSITQVGSPMQYQAEQELLRRAYKKLGKPATGLSEAIDVLKGSNKKPEQDVTPEKMAQGSRLVAQDLITSTELNIELKTRVNKELTRMGVKTHTTKDSERATQTVLSEMQREGKFDKEK